MTQLNITQLALDKLGSVNGVKNILNINAAISGFTMPPAVQLGVRALNAVGINVPTVQQVQAGLTKEIGTLLGIPTSGLSPNGNTQSSQVQSDADLLNSIDWLL
jgi:hypothetical protein